MTSVENQWERLVGTSDVPSTLSFGIDEEERIWLHFEFGEEGFLDTPLDDFCLIFRLFNMVWYSPLLKHLQMCVNSNCHNVPNGGHQRKPDCIPIADFQRDLFENNELEMRRLQRANSIPKPPPGRDDSDQTLAENETSSSDNLS